MNQRTIQGIRRIACPELLSLQGELLTQQVIEISRGQVVRYYPFHEELPFTEWICRRLSLQKDEHGRLSLWNDQEQII